jgi:pimeloyl-ACP methyl ester carboxylesterase
MTQESGRLAGLVAFVIGIALCVSACISPRGQEARDLLADIAAGSGPSRLKEMVPEPSRTTIHYRRAAGQASADFYRSSPQPRGAVVVVPGLTPDGKDDARLVAFAKSLALAQFLVLVPDIANTRALKVSATDSAVIADAVEELAQHFPAGGERSVGLVAISYAVGPALLAASQTPAGRHVRFIVAIGGYYDIEAAIGFVTTGYYRAPDGSWQHAAPNEWGKWVFVRSNADRVGDPVDRDRLRRIAERRLANPKTEIGDLTARLGPEGGAVYDLISNGDPEWVPALIGRLPAAIRDELRRLDLKGRDFRAIAGPVFLVHGRDDAIIPYTESVKLAAALGPRADLTILDHFAHVDAGDIGVADGLRLWDTAIRILEQRDRAPPPGRQ